MKLQSGSAERTTDADVTPELGAWLKSVTCEGGCVNANGTVHIGGFLSSWAVMNGVHTGQASALKTWVSGPVSWNAGEGVRPPKVTLDHGAGRVLYTPYHTEPGESGGVSPQERIPPVPRVRTVVQVRCGAGLHRCSLTLAVPEKAHLLPRRRAPLFLKRLPEHLDPSEAEPRLPPSFPWAPSSGTAAFTVRGACGCSLPFQLCPDCAQQVLY
ncbi:hypothetical protein SAMN00790413_06012 [Deinococcus hopiensis KR-140]|uniref:Uncharacterized protein n=1 Tax=Deinococcus hopiensis KR-140 TaxID=695939 RepID=A0A1W1VX96_9DEIO|nr:hypothetical protein SAMN00790413_06012 [Deinococcus hopiensis KR-140]